MTQEFMTFMEACTTAYQTVEVTKEYLKKAGFLELAEKDAWEIEAGKGYYVTRNDSSILAFRMPKKEPRGFHMILAHGDSPALKLKEQPDLVQEGYVKANVEKYGGMILETWFDRPLSLAGRIVVEEKEKKRAGISLKSIPVDLKKTVGMIPSLAIHMTDAKAKEKISVQQNMLPLVGMNKEGSILAEVAKAAKVEKDEILGMDLYFVNPQKPEIIGLEGEFLSAARLDDLACAFCALKAMTENTDTEYGTVLGILDNEEVGSSTMQGAQSNFLLQTLSRIVKEQKEVTKKNLEQLLADSFLISADNAHGLHPNYPSKADPTNRPVLNGGIVIKYHGGQKYTTSAFSGAYVKSICKKEGIPYQTYQNHSDLLGGSTLGNLQTQSVSVPAADIGLAQLAMHSAYEMMGTKDLAAMIQFMTAFYYD